MPEFDKKRLAELPGAAMRYVLDDERVHLLVIGMRGKKEVDANIKTISGDVTYTTEGPCAACGIQHQSIRQQRDQKDED